MWNEKSNGGGLKKKIGTEDAINKHVTNLNAEPEKREFAVAQLLRIGPDAAPYLIDALIRGQELPRSQYFRDRAFDPLGAALEAGILMPAAEPIEHHAS